MSIWRDTPEWLAGAADGTGGRSRRNGDGHDDSIFQFLAASLNDDELSLQPVLMNASPIFSDSTMNGVSFDVRKVKSTAFPFGLSDDLLKSRELVVVKQPRPNNAGIYNISNLDEIVVEVRILSNGGVRQHANIIDLIAVIYHNASDDLEPQILPALVVEYADFGNITDFQENGHGRDIQDKYDMCHDIAEGLSYIHQCGIIHCDVKASNMLVFKHPTRKFVVKLSDFGFAMFTSDPNPVLTGFTPYWEAPEALRPLNKDFLVQLDVYSYGLLVYTILKNGAIYYQAHPGATPSNIMVMKESNLLPDMFEMNLLLLTQDRCLLLIFCMVIRFCLKADPSERFHSMDHVIEYLVWADPRDLTCEQRPNVHPDFYKEYRFPVGHYKTSVDLVMKAFEQQLEAYCTAVQDSVRMLPALKDLYRVRMKREVDMVMTKPGPEDKESYTACPGLDLTLFRFIKGISVLHAPQGQSAKKLSVQASSPDLSQRPSQIKPISVTEHDLQSHRAIVQKMHPSVQLFIKQQLELYALKQNDIKLKRCTLYNLGFCYMEGFGVAFDVNKALSLVQESAELGHQVAQEYLIKVYSTDKVLAQQHALQIIEWARCSESRQAIATLMQSDHPEYLLSQRRRGLDRLFACMDASQTWTDWKTKFVHLGAVLNMVPLIQKIVQADRDIVNSRNSYGQTPLIVSCQAGNFEATVELLNNDADVNAQDNDGFTALHWIISFPDEHKTAVARVFQSRGVNANLSGVVPREKLTMSPNLKGGTDFSGSPLIWAVDANDLTAVDALLSCGADPFLHVEGFILSALDFACFVGATECVERFAAETGWSKAVSGQHALSDHKRVSPLFWSLQGRGRWERVGLHGRNYEAKAETLLRELIKGGASCGAVMTTQSWSMTAPFAAAWHQCEADIMRAGLKHGFKAHLDDNFAEASSGGPPMSVAIAHKDFEMFTCLVESGASCTWRNKYGQSVLSLAAKEVDDVRFIETLYDKDPPAILEDAQELATAFATAVWCGNLKVAKFLWDRGADRDAFHKPKGLSVLGEMISLRTKNAVDRMQFVLSLPDRDSSDGFRVLNLDPSGRKFESSALHFAMVPDFSNETYDEDAEIESRSQMAYAMLLQKYSSPEYVNSKMGPHHCTPLAMAVEGGSQFAVRLLLENGADPNLTDEYNRTPTDLALWRYCYPSTLPVLEEVDQTDKLAIVKRLAIVNRNTSDILGLLKSYGGLKSVFVFPGWHDKHPGYRDIDWVMARLEEKKNRPPMDTSTPFWGGMDITIPERPMQFESQKTLKQMQADDTQTQVDMNEPASSSEKGNE